MTARELFDRLIEPVAEHIDPKFTCDTFKSGDPDREVHKVATAMFATIDVIRECQEKNIDLLIVHEPTFYDHMEKDRPEYVVKKKRELVKDSGLTIVRYHDHAHMMIPDKIAEGQLDFLGLNGRFEIGRYNAVNRFELDEPITGAELGKIIEKNLGIKHVRIAGCLDKPGILLSCCFGTPGHISTELEETDFVLTGEICEWQEGEMARDLAALGHNKALFVLGHIGSERLGMKLLASQLGAEYDDISFEYIECGEVYNYIS